MRTVVISSISAWKVVGIFPRRAFHSIALQAKANAMAFGLDLYYLVGIFIYVEKIYFL